MSHVSPEPWQEGHQESGLYGAYVGCYEGNVFEKKLTNVLSLRLPVNHVATAPSVPPIPLLSPLPLFAAASVAAATVVAAVASAAVSAAANAAISPLLLLCSRRLCQWRRRCFCHRHHHHDAAATAGAAAASGATTTAMMLLPLLAIAAIVASTIVVVIVVVVSIVVVSVVVFIAVTAPVAATATIAFALPPPLCHCSHQRRYRCHYCHDNTSVVANARHGFAPSSLYIDCCLLSDVVCICRCNHQRDIRQCFRNQHGLLCQYRLCRCDSPHLQARRRQQRMGAAVAMVKSCSGESLKKVYFSQNFT
jgi:hypothetical protein